MPGRGLIPLLLVLATWAVFGDVRHHDFVIWDDRPFVYENPALNPVTPASLLGLWGELNPLTNTAYALLTLVPPAAPGTSVSRTMNPAAFHLANLALHTASVLVVFALLHAVVARPWPAAAGALLFALHPVQVESVAWVMSLKDVLSGCLALLALWQYLASARAAGRSRGRYAVATAAFVGALLAKSTAAAVPLMALALDRWLVQRPWRRSLVALAPWLALAAAWMLRAKAWQPDEALTFVTPLAARPLIALDALAFYVGKVAFPVVLGPDYGRPPELVLQHGWPYWAALAAGIVAAGLALYRRGRNWLRASVAVFTAALVPVLGLVPFLYQRYSTVADRYLYVALLGPALALAWLLAHARGRTATVVSAVALALLAGRAFVQVSYWHDSVTLLEHAIVANPASWVSHNNLGAVFLDQQRFDRALDQYAAVLRLQPDYAEAQYNTGNALLGLGRLDEAMAAFRDALRMKPTLAPAHYNLGTALLLQNRLDEAVVHLGEALRLDPGFANARTNLERAEALRRARDGAAPR